MTLKFIDLFAGIGGFRLGLEQNGMECVFSSEIDKYARKTYETNFGDTPAGDILQIDAWDIPDFNILTAGLPCQPFSDAGQKKGLDDRRARLLDEVIRVAEYKKPEIILIENVVKLLTLQKGKVLNYYISSLESIGYDVRYKILESKYFGVPQERRRVYFVASRSDINSHEFEYPEPLGIVTKPTDILEDESTVDDKYTLRPTHYLYDYRPEFFKTLTSTTSYSTNHRKICVIYHKDTGEQFSGICSQRDGIYHNGEFDNVKLRRLTPRECARLQGFPNSFQIPVSDTQAYIQFGNAVSVPVVRELGKQINRFLRVS